MPSVQDSLVGQTLGHYCIAEKIGVGGMGEVYRARDEHLARDVAIKVLPPGTLTDESARKHFHKEALILSQLNHPNVATIHDFDTQQGVDFLVMEYIPGITLSEKVAAGPLPEKEVLRLGVQLSEGLSAAHEHGVVHRDLKLGNLRLTSDGRLKILDFGLAKLRRPVVESAATESFSETETLAGTLPYMAPEQLLGGEIDARTDIHAAGLVLYEMATGHRPFADVERSQLIGAILQHSPVPPTVLNPKLSPELERIIGKCLEKEKENRYQSAKELAVDLRRLLTPSIVAHPIPRRRFGTGKIISFAAAGSVAVLLTLIIELNPGGIRDKLLGGTAHAPIRSLAVLPLANLSGDPEQEYFADGMTDALITELGKVPTVRIISHQSVMQYKGSKKTLPQIAQELRVDAVVEGSVLHEGDRVRISAQLIGSAPERHLWAKSYERGMRNILALQGDVSQTIAKEIDVRLAPEEKQRLANVRPINPEAYDLYLKGSYFLYKDNSEGFLKAIEHFQRAVDLDTTYAPAHAGLSVAYSTAGLYGVLPFKDAIPKAKVAAKRALELDETLADAHTALGVMNFYDRDWAGADREFKRALELAPNNMLAHSSYGMYLTNMGRFDEAIAVRRRALDLDPLSIPANDFLGWTLYYAGHYDESIRQYLKLIEIEPRNAYFYAWLSGSYLATHASGETVAACRKALELAPEDQFVLTWCGHHLALLGRRHEAVALLDRVHALSPKMPVDPYMLAGLYAGLGDKEHAIGLLERAFEERSPNMSGLALDFPQLGSDPRFQDLLRRMNFPQ
jgi:serine/threonine-protein kinase